MEDLLVWPDGTWLWASDHDEYQDRMLGDDYLRITSTTTFGEVMAMSAEITTAVAEAIGG